MRHPIKIPIRLDQIGPSLRPKQSYKIYPTKVPTKIPSASLKVFP